MNKWNKYISVFIAFLMVVFYSCGIYGYTGVYWPPTVSVSSFENQMKTQSIDLNFKITEELKDKLRKDINVKFVEDSGIIQIEGQLKSYTIKPISIGANNKAYLNRVEIVVGAKRISSFDDKKILKKNISAFVDYDANLNFGNIKDSINNLLTERMVDEIYYEFFMNW